MSTLDLYQQVFGNTMTITSHIDKIGPIDYALRANSRTACSDCGERRGNTETKYCLACYSKNHKEEMPLSQILLKNPYSKLPEINYFKESESEISRTENKTARNFTIK